MITEASEYITEDAYSNSSARWVPEGALVMALAGQGKTKGMVAQLAIRATCNQSMAAIVPAAEVNPRYLYWWLDAQYQNIRNLAGGDLRDGLNLDLLGQIPCPLPAKDEQSSISFFLDRETAKIDELVAEQERLIELLEEKRQAVISHAVTKGLDPAVPMKDSGIDWLGQVPAHWETWKLSHAFGSIGSGTTPPSGERRWYDDGTIPWVTTGELRENLIAQTSQSVTTAAINAFPALRLHPRGSLVIAMYGATIGRLGVLAVDATTNQACCVLSQPQAIAVGFAYYWFLAFRSELVEIYASGGGQPNINQQTIAALRIPAPNLAEQRDVAAFLDHETARMDALVLEAKSVINLLQERRSGLVSAATTGQIDVRQLEVA
jgi:type I restriction enzyme S subunit